MGYIAPEAICRDSGVHVSTAEFKKGDVYSFGMLMCYMLSGIDPFAKKTEANIMYMITVKNERPVIPPHVDTDPLHPVFKEMIQQLWHRDPERRSDFDTIVKQLSAHVLDQKSSKPESDTPSQFLRTLPPLHAGANVCICWAGLGCIMHTRLDVELSICAWLLGWHFGFVFAFTVPLVCTERPSRYCLRSPLLIC